MDDVFAQVGQHSRRSGRVNVAKLLEDLEKEREACICEKRDIDHKLSEIEDWKRQETSRILMKRMDKTRSIEATTRLEAVVREKKAPLMKDKLTVEKRLHDIKTKLAMQAAAPRKDVEVLLRIESILLQILNKLPNNQ